ncbi:glycerol-3-phosphate dehydrogenase [Desulfosediminicola ganghwensis]|uniref:glycerol-3-phosphate dehydrogenase n=1 Tax=Desulfosediminicola ganghwensis TaxID=2569540 RepID=UPI0010AD7C85|nr:glycerol-3-phosphate dehydrogenase [Desulfosediminicola ganghwensis]
MNSPVYDIFVIGGGINGCGIARDAAGRGLSVYLCEQHDLAHGTSSTSTKLIHGGLRYLEYYEFRLVRESLTEREVLLKNSPHIIWPLRFILPHHKGLRPSWLIRLGLFLYDHIGGRKILPATSTVNLTNDETGIPLKGDYHKGFEYSDCWVDDSRLVVLNAMDAAERGAVVETRSRCIHANRENDLWNITLENNETKEQHKIQAKCLINASGPWMDTTLAGIEYKHGTEHIRMVKGSHIIVDKLFDHSKAYIFQNSDGRIIFAIPYENNRYTLIGTTDVDFQGDPDLVEISAEETEYLCSAANEYFTKNISPQEVVSSYSGIRPLFDDGTSDAKAITRDYVLKLDEENGRAPLLSIYGGKITTYRKLAESVLEKLEEYFPQMGAPWTAGASLPGGDFPHSGFEDEVNSLRACCPVLDAEHARRLVRHYGTRAKTMVAGITSREDMGECFGSNLYQFEVQYLMKHEWAKSADDVLWRRTRLGLEFSDEQKAKLENWMKEFKR